jgi:hypothetical protein
MEKTSNILTITEVALARPQFLYGWPTIIGLLGSYPRNGRRSVLAPRAACLGFPILLE